MRVRGSAVSGIASGTILIAPRSGFLIVADSVAYHREHSSHFTWHSCASAFPPNRRLGGPHACAG